MIDLGKDMQSFSERISSLAVGGDQIGEKIFLKSTPTRFGGPTSQLRAFIESFGPLWREGKLADKVYSAFTSSGTTVDSFCSPSRGPTS